MMNIVECPVKLLLLWGRRVSPLEQRHIAPPHSALCIDAIVRNSSSNVKINSIHSSNKILLQCAVHRLCHMYTVHCVLVKYLWCEHTCVLCTLVHSVQYTVCIKLQRLQCAYCSAEWVALHRGGWEGVGGVTGVQAASSGHSTSPASTLSVTPYTPHHHLHKTSKPKINQRLQKRSGRYLQLFKKKINFKNI